MSDNLDAIVARLRSGSTYDDRTDAADLIEAQDAEITRLRAELATARDGAPLNPDRWRGAINDALSGWLHPILEDETPKDALQRLIRFEVMVNMDPETSEHVADLVHAARREGLEEAAQIAASMADSVPWGTVEMGCARIAAAIRAQRGRAASGR